MAPNQVPYIHKHRISDKLYTTFFKRTRVNECLFFIDWHTLIFFIFRKKIVISSFLKNVMASNFAMHCGPCGYEGITKDAKKWCTNCNEGCSGDCEKSHRSSKQTKDHKIIAIADFLKIEDFSICLTCPTHGKKLDLYCKYHSES